MAILLDGKVALITGAGSGIGRATSLIFAREGAQADALGYRGRGRRGDAPDGQAGGRRGALRASDVSKLAEVEALVAKVISTWGRIDCAFNNAGIDGKMAQGWPSAPRKPGTARSRST